MKRLAIAVALLAIASPAMAGKHKHNHHNYVAPTLIISSPVVRVRPYTVYRPSQYYYSGEIGYYSSDEYPGQYEPDVNEQVRRINRKIRNGDADQVYGDVYYGR